MKRLCKVKICIIIFTKGKEEYMKGILSFEEQIKYPNKDIIDFEYVMTRPEIKLLILEKYKYDPAFKMKVDNKYLTDYAFKQRFDTCFESLLDRKGMTLKK